MIRLSLSLQKTPGTEPPEGHDLAGNSGMPTSQVKFCIMCWCCKYGCSFLFSLNQAEMSNGPTGIYGVILNKMLKYNFYCLLTMRNPVLERVNTDIKEYSI